jgi:hypothetical protein
MIRAILTDVVGHASAILDIAEFPDVATCPGSPTVPRCFDLDDDGYTGIDSCPAGEGSDPDDRTPLVFPGALEIAGDGVDNDGLFGERTVSDGNGIFVDSLAGDDAQTGAMFDPVRTLTRARALSDASGLDVWFLAARDEPYTAIDPSVVGTADLIGGLDGDTWLPVATRSKLATDALVDDNRVIAHIDVDTIDTVSDPIASLLDVNVAHLRTSDSATRLTVVQSHVGHAEIANVAFVRFFASDIDRLDVSSSSVTVSHSRIFNGAELQAGVPEFSLTLINSVIFAGASESAAFTNGGTLLLFHCSVFANDGFAAVGVVDAPWGLVGNAFVGGAPAGAVRAAINSAGVFIGNAAVGVPVISQDDDPVPLADVNTCNFPSCLSGPESAHDNIEVANGGFASLFHLSAESPLTDGAFDATALAGVPSSVVVDFDFQCRYGDGAPDYGVDEVVE